MLDDGETWVRARVTAWRRYSELYGISPDDQRIERWEYEAFMNVCGVPQEFRRKWWDENLAQFFGPYREE